MWALACQLTTNGTIPRAEIRRRLEAGEELGRPIPIPKRTMDDMLSRLIKDRGEPAASVTQEQAPDVMDAIDLAVLGTTNLEVQRVRRRQAAGETLTSADMSKLRTAGLTISEYRKRKERKGRPNDGNGTANAVSPSSLTSQLSKALGEKGKQDTPTAAGQQQHTTNGTTSNGSSADTGD